MFKKILEEKGTASVGQKEVKIIDLQRATKYVVIVQAFNKLVSETVRNSNFTLTFFYEYLELDLDHSPRR